MNETTTRDPGRKRAGSLVWGAFFLLVGAVLLAGNLGLEIPVRIWDWWPFLLIALGVARLLAPGRSERRGGGLWLVIAGIYGWIGTRGLFGLTWSTAWPIFVIGVGLQMVLQATFGWPEKGDDRERS
jgi:hypothetical protein